MSNQNLALIILHFRNHDTCRIEFFIIPSILLSLLINHEFSFMEVISWFSFKFYQIFCSDYVDVQYLLGIRGHHATIIHALKNRLCRDNYCSLFVRVGFLPRTVHLELGVPLLCGIGYRSYCCGGRNRANRVICRFLLSLRHQR